MCSFDCLFCILALEIKIYACVWLNSQNEGVENSHNHNWQKKSGIVQMHSTLSLTFALSIVFLNWLYSYLYVIHTSVAAVVPPPANGSKIGKDYYIQNVFQDLKGRFLYAKI